VGLEDGAIVGFTVGLEVDGTAVGAIVGFLVGLKLGCIDGRVDG